MSILRDKLKFDTLLQRKRMGLVLLGFGLRMACTPRPINRGVAQAASADRRVFNDDTGRIVRADQGLLDVLEFSGQNPRMLAGAQASGEPLRMRAEERTHLRQSWAALLDHLRELEGLKSQWQQIALQARDIDRPTHARAYMLS